MNDVLDMIAFDADDTLWHNEPKYRAAQDRFAELFPSVPRDRLDEALYDVEMGHLDHFGYGIKAFTLSLFETAARLVNGDALSTAQVRAILQIARDVIDAPVECLPGVAQVLAELSREYPLMIVTKGDLLEQRTKVERSGLASHFCRVEVLHRKSVDVYRALLARYDVVPDRFLMVGNSLRSDVLPVVELGAHAVHVPYPATWAHEEVAVSEAQRARYTELETIGDLPALIARLRSGEA